jgi:uncharacterized protein (TIRG00374 family)
LTTQQSEQKRTSGLQFVGQLLLGLLLFSLLIFFGDFSSLQRLTSLRIWPLVGAFVCTLGIAFSVGLRWGVLTRALAGRKVTHWLQFCYYFLLNRMLGFFVPKDLSDLGGRAALLVGKHKVPVALAGLSVVLDRVSDVLVMLIFLGPSVLFFSDLVTASVGITLMVALVIAVFLGLRFGHHHILRFSVNAYNWFIKWLSRLPVLRRRTWKPVQSLNLSLAVLQRAYLLSLMKFIFTVLRWVCFALALRIPGSMGMFLFGTPVGQLSFLFAFTPGGLGIFEAGWFAILSRAGLAETYISPLLVGQRVFTTLFVGIALLLSVLLSLSGKSETLEESA